MVVFRIYAENANTKREMYMSKTDAYAQHSHIRLEAAPYATKKWSHMRLKFANAARKRSHLRL